MSVRSVGSKSATTASRLARAVRAMAGNIFS